MPREGFLPDRMMRSRNGSVASPERFELPTRCLGRSRSILLSYGDPVPL